MSVFGMTLDPPPFSNAVPPSGEQEGLSDEGGKRSERSVNARDVTDDPAFAGLSMEECQEVLNVLYTLAEFTYRRWRESLKNTVLDDLKIR